MKKLFVLIVLIGGIVWGAEAQSKGITFAQTKEWKKVLKKAKKEKKLIFIDCYTSWCGPCKMLSSQVFTREDVGNQFNVDFVNVKYDMEKDADGVMLKDKFEVKAFPTLVFVDPNTQQVVQDGWGWFCRVVNGRWKDGKRSTKQFEWSNKAVRGRGADYGFIKSLFDCVILGLHAGEARGCCC